MLTGDFEAIGEDIYRCSGFPNDVPAAPMELAERVLGRDSVRYVPRHALPGHGATARVNGVWRIYIVEQAPEQLRRFVLLHELAHAVLGRTASEQDCNALAAVLLAPRPAFVRAVKARGRRLRSLARAFVTTESCVGLRLGEVTHQPTALVQPDSIRVRGEPYSWPEEAELREMVRGKRLPGLRRATLSDDRTRAVLRAV